ncbi:hypothetical protein SCLCIDRAFT_1223470 [Scleroderma citrinum Foug A]|uniref:Uncharacterized protein n=1 Tax=Scleroderma citrinum Foug A TaxID=1036808 RepID=A0A0C3D8K8_9AGAM|nr:hypothetical protein SCLCIDRAFT_1223470 [Scleroderma citrinum Foug A]
MCQSYRTVGPKDLDHFTHTPATFVAHRGIMDTRVVGMPSHLLLYAYVSTVLASVMIGVVWHRAGFTVMIPGHMG